MLIRQIGSSTTPVGHYFEFQNCIVFFGTKAPDEARLQRQFQELQFLKILQNHSDVIVKASETPERADAHWVTDFNNALLISTADCLPIFIVCDKFICGIHAGWRGVKSEIVLKSIETLIEHGAKIENAQIFIGPYIHRENFEVDLSLATEFSSLYETYFKSKRHTALAVGLKEPVVYQHPTNASKAYVDLLAIVKAQCALFAITKDRIHVHDVDTFTSPEYSSFRRDKTIGRNLSFVARRP